jgi:hypothetical protein
LTIAVKNYSEITNGFTKMKNILTDEVKASTDFSLEPIESGV